MYDYLKLLAEALSTNLKLINEICLENGIAAFTQQDKAVIDEYLGVMKPIATSLDKLQSHKESYLGFLLPTLFVLRSRLEAMKSDSLKYANPLLSSLLENPFSEEENPKGFKARFSNLFNDMDLLIATAIHPFFKLPTVHLINPDKVDSVRARLLNEVRTEAQATMGATAISMSSDEEDEFFKVSLGLTDSSIF